MYQCTYLYPMVILHTEIKCVIRKNLHVLSGSVDDPSHLWYLHKESVGFQLQ